MERIRRASSQSIVANLTPALQDKIEHFIVLFMENRAADHTFGCMLGENPEFDGIPKEGRQIMKDPKNPSAGNVTVTCGTAPYVCSGGMGFSSNGHFEPEADQKVYPYGKQGNEWDYENGAKSEAIEMFSGEQLPIKKAVSENFAVFVRLCNAIAAFPHAFSRVGSALYRTSSSPPPQQRPLRTIFIRSPAPAAVSQATSSTTRAVAQRRISLR